MARYYIMGMHIALEEFAVEGPSILQRELVLGLLAGATKDVFIFDELDAAKAFVKAILPFMPVREHPIFEVQSLIEIPTTEVVRPIVASLEAEAARNEQRKPMWQDLTLKESKGFSPENIQIVRVHSALGYNLELSPERKAGPVTSKTVVQSQPAAASSSTLSTTSSSSGKGFGGFAFGFLKKARTVEIEAEPNPSPTA